MAESPSTHTPHEHRSRNWYDRIYKPILLLPLIVLILSLTYLAMFYQQEGDIIRKDVSLTGGTTITVFTSHDPEIIREHLLAQFPDIETRAISDIQTGEQKGFFVETAAPIEEIKPALEKELGFTLTPDKSSIEFTGSALSSSFYNQLRIAVIAAFISMAIVVFIIFKTPFRSFSIIISVLADIVMTLAVVNLIGTQMSLAGIVAILMLIGYAVDTDMLLTTRVLRGEGPINSRIWGAFKTGILMTITAIVAVGISLLFIGSYSDTLHQMFTIILIGLGFDIFNTWITNASLLKWYSEVKKLA